MMTTRKYEITFLTPAFLGGADQSAQWRSPPFKALLRQWWRVAWAIRRGLAVDVARLREDEGRLFGVAADKAATRSRVRIRLSSWEAGTLRRWTRLATVTHPEVRFPIDCGLYLGYGPVVLRRDQRVPALKSNAAIQAGEHATLSLAFPEEDAEAIDTALALIDRYATVGGRARNGWGSFTLEPAGASPRLADPTQAALRPWADALEHDWPHALGADDQGPLIWRTERLAEWAPIMQRLAEIKIGLRTQFRFPNDRPPHPRPLDRHWLSYPVTGHAVRPWGAKRLPNSLRFKVRPAGDGGLVGTVFHVPCKPPRDFRPDLPAIRRVWERVHRYLDRESGLQRAA